MSKKIIDGVWVAICDWVDPESGETCNLGRDDMGDPDGSPRRVVDPDAGQNPEKHYQCGIHHGIVKQEDRTEFQIPGGDSQEPNEDIITKDTFNKE